MKNIIYLSEVGIRKNKSLYKLDNAYRKLKNAKNSQDRNIVVNVLEKELERIFGTNFIVDLYYHGRYKDTFGIIPYIRGKSDNILNIRIENKKDIIKIFNIKEIHFLIGIKTINLFTPEEMTAITLHEIGHLTHHLSSTSIRIYMVLTKLKIMSESFSPIIIVGIPFFILFVLTSRSLNFFQHPQEYNADKFPIKYGYGDEMVSVLEKFQDYEFKITSQESWFSKLMRWKSILVGSTHPSENNRISRILQTVKEDYLHLYPDNKKLKEYVDQVDSIESETKNKLKK